MSKFCSNCGAEATAGASFCHSCGNAIVSQADSTNVRVERVHSFRNVKKRTWMIAGVFLLIVITVMSMLRASSNQKFAYGSDSFEQLMDDITCSYPGSNGPFQGIPGTEFWECNDGYDYSGRTVYVVFANSDVMQDAISKFSQPGTYFAGPDWVLRSRNGAVTQLLFDAGVDYLGKL